MSVNRFLIPVGAAVAALLPVGVQALPAPGQSDVTRGPSSLSVEHSQVLGPVIQTMQYLLGSQTHALLLRQAASGVLYAGHESHVSHASHGSHRSGR